MSTQRLRALWEAMVLTSTLPYNDRENSRAQFDMAMRDLIEQYEAVQRREQNFAAALFTICHTNDSGPWISIYRDAGGGYEGLQAIARAALNSNPGDEEYVRRAFASHIGETAGAQNPAISPEPRPIRVTGVLNPRGETTVRHDLSKSDITLGDDPASRPS